MNTATPQSAPVDGDAVQQALLVINDAENDARHRGDYARANALVKARVTLYRASATPPPASQERGGLRWPSSLGIAAIAREIWGNPIPPEAYAFAKRLHSAASPPSSAAEDVTAGGTSTSDDELPGMWSPSDLTGGATDAAEQAKPMSIQQMFDAEQAQAGELPEPVAVVGPSWLIAWTGDGPIAPLVRAHGLKIGDGLYTADQMRDYANACRLAGGVTVDDAMVERLAKYIYQQEARKCSTLDAYLHHMKGWPRALPEARAMLVAALGAKDGR